MRNWIWCLLFIAGWRNASFASAAGNDSTISFNRYKKEFTERLWKIYPEWASSIGYHKYDQLLPIPNVEERKKEIDFAKNELKKYIFILTPNTLTSCFY